MTSLLVLAAALMFVFSRGGERLRQTSSPRLVSKQQTDGGQQRCNTHQDSFLPERRPLSCDVSLRLISRTHPLFSALQIKYTGFRDRPHEERQARFQNACRDGRSEVVSSKLLLFKGSTSFFCVTHKHMLTLTYFGGSLLVLRSI